MRLLYFYALVAVMGLRCAAQSVTPLLPDYNNAFYPTVLESAIGVGRPFLLQQGYLQMSGVTVSDTSLIYNNQVYKVHEQYVNPASRLCVNNGYYICSRYYHDYGIEVSQSVLWPEVIPYALYDSATATFNATIDCVGYGTRLLAATGDSSQTGNAYRQLMNTIHSQGTTPFASPGWVASAYEFAAAFPTLTNTAAGWQYVAGNVEADRIAVINDTAHNIRKPYTGKSKGGFANVLPGDVLSFGYAPGGESNGHFMVIEQQPYLLNADSLQARYFPLQSAGHIDTLLSHFRVYAVPLFDCSGKNVHFFDSRKLMSGIGHGTLLILTDHATDTPQGFIFSPPATAISTNIPGPIGTELMGSHMVAISIGRYSR